MSETPKRVIVEHRSIDPASRKAQLLLQSEKHRENWLTWNKVIQGGVIVCRTYGLAVNMRQSLYTTRKLAREVDGQTMWDHLTIRLNYNDPRLIVEAKADAILEIIPATHSPPPLTEDNAAPSDPSGRTYVIPTPPDVYEEDGRPPLAFEPDAEDVHPAPTKPTE